MNEITVPDLEDSIDRYRHAGFRLDMIKPADEPREALMSKGTELLKLVRDPKAGESHDGKEGEWVRGRAGMEYRDLIPGRMDGRLIASHIKLTQGGEVPDYVHYHKIEFQMIYCKLGRIKVVYEDQGPPFWLETGDCILQPPEIRHRVLECTAGAEVIEVSMPAEHETWVEHDMKLPNSKIDHSRHFNGQNFVRSIAKEARWISDSRLASLEIRRIGILEATKGRADALVVREVPPRGVGETENGVFLGHRFRYRLNASEVLLIDIFSFRD